MIKKLYADGSSHKEVDQLRPMLKRVAKVIGDRVGNTLGPGGRNYMTTGGITNDGVSILDDIRFEDEREDSLADAFVEVARRQDKDAGDGTTTATTFATALIPLVLDDVLDINTPIPGMKTVMEIKRQLEDELTEATLLLKDQFAPVTAVEELTKVANTAMEGHECSQLIAETVFAVGYNSNILLEEGFNEKVTATTVAGVHMPLKIETPAMFTNATTREAAHENAIVIVANHVFEAYEDLSPFFTELLSKKVPVSPIVIVGKHFSVPFTAQMVGISRQTKLPMLLLNANGLRDEEIEDIAAFVGARYIDTHPKEGEVARTIAFADAGRCKKIVAGPKQTSFVGGDGIVQGKVTLRVLDLKMLADKEQNPNERNLLLRRAAGLQGGVATLYVDAKTAVDRYYLKKKVEDAVNSCKAALEHGTVAGGGLAYLEVANQMPEGYLKTILPVIHARVQRNAGGDLAIDPTVVRDALYTNQCALQNAVAVVKILVTLEGVIADKERDVSTDLAKAMGYVV